ncbi:MAG: hypothetical protein GEV06_10015 [Luteitalea sp.]|nr:hypothetical protein [Luteitalea sp.]
MSEFTLRSDHVDVEEIMRQIRARVREKRGVDYTEQELRDLASVRLEQFLDPQSVRSELLKAYRKRQDLPPNFRFEEDTLYASSRGALGRMLVLIRRALNPILKLFFSAPVVSHALHLQSKMNDHFLGRDALQFELFHNIVVELTRLGIENRNLKMRIESIQSRLDFHERRARALEGVVEYRADKDASEAEGGEADAEGERATRRRRRRRGRKRSIGKQETENRNQDSGIRSQESGLGNQESGLDDRRTERADSVAPSSAGTPADDSSTSET